MRITSVRSDGSAIVRGKTAFPMKKKKRKKGAIQLPLRRKIEKFAIVSLTELNVTFLEYRAKRNRR